MNTKLAIENDLKKALLAGDKTKVSILKGIKAAVLELEIDKNCRDQGLADVDMVSLLRKEAKKRKDTAEIYQKAGDQSRRDRELAEAAVIDSYLPAQIPENDINKIIDKITDNKSISIKDMGRIIAAVKEKTGPAAEGGAIARLVKARVQQ